MALSESLHLDKVVVLRDTEFLVQGPQTDEALAVSSCDPSTVQTPSEAVEIVSSMSDSIYSDQMGLWG